MKKNYEELYFDWLLNRVKNKSHFRLLRLLFETEFVYTIPMDENRASDGIQLRYKFIDEKGINEEEFHYIYSPCNLFEMILALSIRISTIMSDPYKSDETHIWFWRMISNMGLSKSTDNNFDDYFVDVVIDHFLSRNYGPNGRGSLFFVKNEKHIEDLQIWDQAMLYLIEFEERRRPNGTFG